MKILILLILLSSTLFSQKLWEIEVNPNDLLRDVMEIPNSDLLLFTYNTGKLEIRNSQDGSFVKDVENQEGATGNYTISGDGLSYYYSRSMDLDSIKLYDLLTDRVENSYYFDIDNLTKENNFDGRGMSVQITNDMKYLFGVVSYQFDAGMEKTTKTYFYLYDLINLEIKHTTQVYTIIEQKGYFIEKCYSSPDSKYIVTLGKQFGSIEPINVAKIFEIENMEFIKSYNEDDNDSKFTALNNPHFLKNNLMGINFNEGISFLDFPSLKINEVIEVYNKFGFLVAGFHYCENELIINSYNRKAGGKIHEYEYWFAKYHINEKNLIYNSYQKVMFEPGVKMVLIKNCSKVVFINDIEYTLGKIVCYDFQTLNVENLSIISDYFSKTKNLINFNSQEFIGQTSIIELYNSAGLKVGTLYNGIINQQNYNFNLPDIPSGAYYLQCQLPNQSFNFNFVVVR